MLDGWGYCRRRARSSARRSPNVRPSDTRRNALQPFWWLPPSAVVAPEGLAYLRPSARMRVPSTQMRAKWRTPRLRRLQTNSSPILTSPASSILIVGFRWAVVIGVVLLLVVPTLAPVMEGEQSLFTNPFDLGFDTESPFDPGVWREAVETLRVAGWAILVVALAYFTLPKIRQGLVWIFDHDKAAVTARIISLILFAIGFHFDMLAS
jgi:hypothetical protein